jgi:hypothetical protein
MEITAVYLEHHIKHITLCEQIVEFQMVYVCKIHYSSIHIRAQGNFMFILEPQGLYSSNTCFKDQLNLVL